MADTFEILSAVQEFYSLMAIESAMLMHKKLEPFKHSHARWFSDFTNYKTTYTHKLAQAIYDYTAIVCGGEMRHADEKAERYNINFVRSVSRNSAFRESHKYTATSVLSSAVKVFECEGWSGGYGGKAWANIARAGLMYGNVPESVFVDHCVDLSHNSSVYFDKPDNGVLYIDDRCCYKRFLDFKYIATPEEMLNKIGCSVRTKRLLDRALTLDIISVWIDEDKSALKHADWYIKPDYIDMSVERVLVYEPLQWGNSGLVCILQESGKRFDDMGNEIYPDDDDDYESDEDEEERRRRRRRREKANYSSGEWFDYEAQTTQAR